jgi:RHS repeat-associated protein
MFQAEMNFDAWREDKAPPPGGVLMWYVEDRAVQQATKRGAKGVQPLSPKTTYYAYDAAGNLLAEADETKTIKRYYTWGNGLISLYTINDSVLGTKNFTYHFSPQGSALAVTDNTGVMKNRYAYTVFGELTQEEALPQPFKYVGQYGVMAEPDNLYCMRARYYDATLGRFLQQDPLGIGGGDINLYGYVGSNPVMGIDPSGLTWASNLRFLWDWATGAGSSNRVYGPSTIESQEMQVSPGANALRDAFYGNGGQSISSFGYGTVQAAKDTVLNPNYWPSTALQVGGFAGASAMNNGNGTVTFTIQNVAGTNSFFYHQAPDVPWATGPMRNITQTFTWTEGIHGPNGKLY